jgi:hypothetical protein
MAGELLIQVMDIARLQAIRPALDELEAARALGLQSRVVLRAAAASPLVRREGYGRLAGLLGRILRQPELELRIFLAPRELDAVVEGVVHVLCFENGAQFSLTSLVGPNWVVLDSTFAAFIDLDWFRATFLDVDPASDQLAYPRRGEGRHWLLSRDDVARLAAGVQPFLDEPATAPEVRSAAEGLARLAAKVLSAEDLALAHTSLL